MDSATHLGILHSSQKNINDKRVENCLSIASKTLYALFGAGLHGRNGLNPVSSRKIWITYIIPRLLHGSEFWTLDSKHIKALECFQRQKLRQLQGLSDRTSNAAVLGLIGIWPVEAEIDRRILTLYRNVADAPDSVEHNIALRQLATKTLSSASWFIQVERTLQKYDLPSTHVIMEQTPSKGSWKRSLKEKISNYWNQVTAEAASGQSTVRFLTPDSLDVRSPSLLWNSAISSHRDTEKAFVKAKLLTGTYRLQAHEAKFNKGYAGMVASCHLCKLETEDRAHFLLRCPSLSSHREIHLLLMKSCLSDERMSWDDLPAEDQLGVLLDGNHLASHTPLSCRSRMNVVSRAEKIARDWVFDLHLKRWKLLGSVTHLRKPH